MKHRLVVLIVVVAIALLTAPGLLLPPAATSGATPTWQKTALDAGKVHAVLVHPIDPAIIFAGTDRGLFRSTDHGETWGPYGTGIKTGSSTTLRILALAAAADGSRMYAGTSGGAFQSGDRGATWSQGSGMFSGSVLLTYYAIDALAVDPLHPETVYAGDSGMMTEGRVLKSADGGAIWTSAASGISGHDIAALAIDPGKPSTVYAVVKDSLYVSGDAGSSWTKTIGRMEVNSSEVDVLTVVVTSDAVYAGTTAGVWKSSNGGVSWSQGTGLNSTGILRYFFGIAALSVDPVKPSVLYAGDSGLFTSGGVSMSTDSGGVWTQVGGALTADVSCLAVDSLELHTVYAGTDTGLFRLVSVPIVRFRITASAPQGRGTVLPALKEVAEGESVTLNLLPDAGYRLTLLTDNGASVTSLVRNNTYELSGVTTGHVVAAIFEPIPIVLPPPPSHTLVLTIGSLVMSVDGGSATLDSPPIIREGRTLLPIRAVIEALGG
ncbi:MAG: stalk domain-containing protein, partial [Caldiserica bacterium]|nr:stalk domain-containing protein [Caldisericota bacterium]